MRLLSSFIAGLLFGVGLILSGMTDPAKVIGFLDISGEWNPSLAFVMVGAISVSYFAFRSAQKRSTTIIGQPVIFSIKKEIDLSLIAGSITFGIGWGLAGYCPGPALASIATGDEKPIIFFVAMLIGMGIYEVLQKALPR
jgi:uncharacterized membrane protein YedE/YeeE